MAIYSMTGFGRSVGGATDGASAITVEIRSVNGRGLKLFVRTPNGLAGLEPKIQSVLSEKIVRGSVDCMVYVGAGINRSKYRIDTDLIEKYRRELADYQQQAGVSGAIDIGMLAGLPGVVVQDDANIDADAIWETVAPVLDDALNRLLEMRASEGDATRVDLLNKLDELSGYRVAIHALAPGVAAAHVARWKARVGKMLKEADNNLALLPENIERELLISSDRADINEELVRLESHEALFRKTLAEGGAVGKKLDFLAQEMLRECNTIGSKANSAEITEHVVSAKCIVEKIKEQSANIE